MDLYYAFVFARLYQHVYTYALYLRVRTCGFILRVCFTRMMCLLSMLCINLRQFQMAGLAHRKQPSWACAAAIILDFLKVRILFPVLLSGSTERERDLKQVYNYPIRHQLFLL